MGKLALLQLFAEMAQKRADATEQEYLALMEKYHGEFGSTLLASWKFPEEHQHIARYHALSGVDQPSNRLCLIALANLLANKTGYQVHDQVVNDEDIHNVAQRLRVGASVMDAAVKQMDEYMAAQG